MMLEIAVLGAGRIGRIHAAQHRGASRCAPGRGRRRRCGGGRALASVLGAATLSVAEAIAADAVLIASPTPTHADYIEQAAQRGPGGVLREADRSVGGTGARHASPPCDAAGVALMVGFNRRFDPHFATLKQRLDAARSARWRLLTIISRDPAPPPPSYVATSGGLFRDMMIHDLDMARFLLGEEPVEVPPPRRAWSIRRSARRATWTPRW